VSKKALIITDGTDSIENVAKSISEELDDFKVKVCSADKFEGTDLLSADIFFIGCERPSHPSFSYLEKMLAHINLAARKCGVFTVKEKTLDYLCGIVNACEAKSGAPLLVVSKIINKPALKKWINGIVK